MSSRLDAAKAFRALVNPKELIGAPRLVQRHQDLWAYGNAGHAVAELAQYAKGLAEAYDIHSYPTPMLLSPQPGELAGAWADRAVKEVLSWCRQHFHAADAIEQSQGTRHQMPRVRVRA